MIVSSTRTYSVFHDVAEIDVDIFVEQHFDLLWHGLSGPEIGDRVRPAQLIWGPPYRRLGTGGWP